MSNAYTICPGLTYFSHFGIHSIVVSLPSPVSAFIRQQQSFVHNSVTSPVQLDWNSVEMLR